MRRTLALGGEPRKLTCPVMVAGLVGGWASRAFAIGLAGCVAGTDVDVFEPFEQPKPLRHRASTSVQLHAEHKGRS